MSSSNANMSQGEGPTTAPKKRLLGNVVSSLTRRKQNATGGEEAQHQAILNYNEWQLLPWLELLERGDHSLATAFLEKQEQELRKSQNTPTPSSSDLALHMDVDGIFVE